MGMSPAPSLIQMKLSSDSLDQTENDSRDEARELVSPEAVSGASGTTDQPECKAEADASGSTILIEAARRFRDEGRIPIPLSRIDSPDPSRAGKAPIFKKTEYPTLGNCDDDYLEAWWGRDKPLNLGVLLEPPYLVVDLDSKQDQGRSVNEWLEAHPEIARWPHEKTRNGVHLHVRCPNLPEEIVSEGGKRCHVERRINEAVNAEFFFGGVITVSPSRHPDGGAYRWVIRGEPPEMSWVKLCEALSVDVDAPVKQGSRSGCMKKPDTLGDLTTLDIVGLCEELGIYGKLIDEDEGKHSVRCPWRDSHSDTQKPWDEEDASTVVWEASDGSWPGFCCLHASHGPKSLADLLEWAEKEIPGIVDRYCEKLRKRPDVEDERPFVRLPGEGRLVSEFAAEVGDLIGSRNIWFDRTSQVVAVRVTRELAARPAVKEKEPEGQKRSRYVEWTGFVPVDKHAAITTAERYINPGVLRRDGDGDEDDAAWVEIRKSMSVPVAQTLLESPQLRERLPKLERIFHVPIPLIDPDSGELTLPLNGYDRRFNSYLVSGAPEIRKDVSPAEAIRSLRLILDDFCFVGDQDLVHAIAALLTPFCRGLYPRQTARTPVFFFHGNRPRTGKDYLAGCVSILYEGRTNEDPPLDRDSAELRKKITSAMIGGRRRMHFANCSGVIKNPVLEQVVTNERWNDRVLGGNSEVTIPNEMEFSLSGNTGIIYSPDFAARTRLIRLHFAEEHENQRKFKNPDLHGLIRDRRGYFLSALYALVRYWDEQGRPRGKTPFSSFPCWAEVVGGIMGASGLGDPCLPDEGSVNVGGDSDSRDMKRLFLRAYSEFPERWIQRAVVRKLVERSHEDQDDDPLFGFLEMKEHGGKVRFGNMMDQFMGREFEGIRMCEDASVSRKERRKIRFSKEVSEEVDLKVGETFFDRIDSSEKPETESKSESDPKSAPQGGGCGSPGGLPYSANVSDPETESDKSIERAGETTETPSTPTDWKLITDMGDFEEIAEAIRASDQPVALDLETYGPGKKGALDPFKGSIRLVCLRVFGELPLVIDLRETGTDLGGIGPALNDSGVIIHNALFDLSFLRSKLGLNLKRVKCTMTASKLLKRGRDLPKKDKPNSLGYLLNEYGVADLPKELGGSDWSGGLSEEQLRYAADDVRYLNELLEKLEAEIREKEMERVWDLEMGVLPVAVGMRVRGFQVDRGALESFKEDTAVEMEEKKRTFLEKLGDDSVNPNSPSQLLKAFDKIGIHISGTNRPTLSGINHPAARALLEYRDQSGLVSKTESLIKALAGDGRLHGVFDPSGSDSGRFSCKEPNLQSISRGKIREAFVAPDGRKLVCADYSQIELRIAAVVRGEEKMLEAYRNGDDLHRLTASLVVGKKPEDIKPEERQLAKAVNFGLLYGQGAKGLAGYAKTSYGVEMTVEEAERFRDRFFEGYPGMKAYDGQARYDANFAEPVSTRLGRRRELPSGESNWWKRFTSRLNAPVQGGAADALKLALVGLDKALPEDSFLVSTVHDEIIVECPEDQAGEIKSLLETAMVEAMTELYPEVACEVEAHVGDSWAEAK